MTRAEKLLAARFMKLAADQFANHGCNDVEEYIFAGISEEEKNQLERDYNAHNDPSGDPEQYCELMFIGDSSWMSFLAERLDLEGK